MLRSKPGFPLPRRFSVLLPACLWALLGSGASFAAEASPLRWWERVHPSAGVTHAWVENISRTSAPADRRSTSTWQVDVGGAVPRQLAPSWLATAGADVSALWVRHYSLTNEARVGGQLMLQRKFGLGPAAWVVRGHLGTRYAAARQAAARGWTTETGLQVAKRVLPELQFTVAADHREHAASHPVFDLKQESVSLAFAWAISASWTLGGRVQRLSGDIVADAAWPVWGRALSGELGPVVQRYYTSRPWSVTNRYGPGWVSYNVEADVDLWSLDLTYAWSRGLAATCAWERVAVENRIGVQYPGVRWSLRVVQQF